MPLLIHALCDLTMHLSQCPYKIPLGYWEPILSGTVGLILGQSNLSLKGITALTGIIDGHSTGKIAIVITAPLEWTFQKGVKIAQLLLLLYIPSKEKIVSIREDCSTGALIALSTMLYESKKP